MVPGSSAVDAWALNDVAASWELTTINAVVAGRGSHETRQDPAEETGGQQQWLLCWIVRCAEGAQCAAGAGVRPTTLAATRIAIQRCALIPPPAGSAASELHHLMRRTFRARKASGRTSRPMRS